jgi:hypothetical protein
MLEEPDTSDRDDEQHDGDSEQQDGLVARAEGADRKALEPFRAASIAACPTATIGDAWGSTIPATSSATPIATAAVTKPISVPLTPSHAG